MPYDIVRQGDQFFVRKTSDEEIVGCHDTEDEAVAQIAAIESHEKQMAWVQDQAEAAQTSPLGKMVGDLIERRAKSTREPVNEVLEKVGKAAGISASTVKQIRNGQISCPPLDRLRGLAKGLGVPSKRLVDAAKRGGCSYETEE